MLQPENTVTGEDLGDVEGRMFKKRGQLNFSSESARSASAVAGVTQQGIFEIFPDRAGQCGQADHGGEENRDQWRA